MARPEPVRRVGTVKMAAKKPIVYLLAKNNYAAS
jgi:hypothetical protein